jgi:uncharacterized membrane protein YccC
MAYALHALMVRLISAPVIVLHIQEPYWCSTTCVIVYAGLYP